MRSTLSTGPNFRDNLSSPDLAACFAMLLKRGEIDVQAKMSAHYPTIRAGLAELFPQKYDAQKQLSDEGIRAHFSPYFKSLKTEVNSKHKPNRKQ